MEALAKQILQELTVLSQTDKKLKLENLVRTFFNCKSKNNRMLLLGVDNKTIIQELLGCSADAIIKEDADYFIRILKGRDDCMTISFRALSSPLTFEEQEQIKALFTFYGNDSNVNLEVAFANNRIPDLIIKKGFPTCLETRLCQINCVKVSFIPKNSSVGERPRGKGRDHPSRRAQIYIN